MRSVETYFSIIILLSFCLDGLRNKCKGSIKGDATKWIIFKFRSTAPGIKFI